MIRNNFIVPKEEELSLKLTTSPECLSMVIIQLGETTLLTLEAYLRVTEVQVAFFIVTVQSLLTSYGSFNNRITKRNHPIYTSNHKATAEATGSSVISPH